MPKHGVLSRKKRRAEAAVKRSPARKRARRGTEPTRTQAQLAESRASSMAKLVGTAQLRRRASHLGAQEPEQAPRVDRAQRPSWQHNHDAERMSQRLKAGRTVDICMQLMAFNLLSPITTAENKLQLRAAKGLSAKKRSVPHQNFFIIDVFHRRGVPLVDIAPLTPKEKDEPGALFFLGAIQTVKQENLREISFRSRPTSIQRKKVEFQLVDVVQDNVIQQLCEWLSQAQKVAELQRSEPNTWFAPQAHEVRQPLAVRPSSAIAHSLSHPDHSTQPRQDRGEVKFLLHLPTPIPMEIRPHRCRTCSGHATDEESNAHYFSHTDDDILQAASSLASNLRIFRGTRSGLICISVHCLLWMLQAWYEELNMRLGHRQCILYRLASYSR